MKKIMLAILIFADQCSAEISTVKSCPENQTGCYLVTERNGLVSSATEGSRLYRRAQEWLSLGGVVQPADPSPPQPTPQDRCHADNQYPIIQILQASSDPNIVAVGTAMLAQLTAKYGGC